MLRGPPDPSALTAVYDDEMTRAVAYIEERSLSTLPEEPGRLVLAGDRWDSARHRIPVVVAHEVWPGRHAHTVRASQLPSEVRRRLTSTLTMNGWALYAQELMADVGYDILDPLQLRLHLVGMLRAAVQVDLDIGHTRGMTPTDAMDELVRRVPVTRRQAELDVRRFCETPATALTDAAGRRALRELRDATSAAWR